LPIYQQLNKYIDNFVYNIFRVIIALYRSMFYFSIIQNQKITFYQLMKTVKIYLRVIEQHKVKKFSLYDSHGNGGIDELVTEVVRGGTVYWLPDCNSNIKEIVSIFPKKNDWELLTTRPTKLRFCKGIKIKIPIDAPTGEEAYGIKCITTKGDTLIIDPMLRIPPPP
jgi:hypothetical protein